MLKFTFYNYFFLSLFFKYSKIHNFRLSSNIIFSELVFGGFKFIKSLFLPINYIGKKALPLSKELQNIKLNLSTKAHVASFFEKIIGVLFHSGGKIPHLMYSTYFLLFVFLIKK
jgi:hypothetical protein